MDVMVIEELAGDLELKQTTRHPAYMVHEN